MARAFDRQQLCLGWDHLHRALEFFDRAERIAAAVNEEGRRTQVGKMLCALLFGTARRMERVGEQEHARRQIGFFGAEHARLAAAVGVTAKEDLSTLIPVFAKSRRFVHHLLHRGYCVSEAGAVAGGVAGAGRPKGSCLTKREIASEDREASSGKRVGQDAKQPGLRISSRAMGQDQCIAIGGFGSMQKTAHFRIGRFLDELRDGDFRQATILNGVPTRKYVQRTIAL